MSPSTCDITFGYRREMTVGKAIRTLFMWHNETANIWSHLIAALWFAGKFAHVLLASDDCAATKWPMLVFQAGAIYMFAVSTLYHLLLCVSRSSYTFWRKMDFHAILVVMFGMFWPFCYYTHNQWCIAIAFVLTCACFCMTTMPAFQKMHTLRPLVFGILGAWGAATVWIASPATHVTVLCATQLSLHAIGAVIYTARWPELRTGRFNYFNSHFFFHCIPRGKHTTFLSSIV